MLLQPLLKGEMQMELRAYSIRDIKAGAYNPPFFKHTDGEAQRDMTTAVNDPKTQVNMYPEDFQLFHVGKYDDQTGVFTPLDTPRHIIDASQLKRVVQ